MHDFQKNSPRQASKECVQEHPKSDNDFARLPQVMASKISPRISPRIGENPSRLCTDTRGTMVTQRACETFSGTRLRSPHQLAQTLPKTLHELNEDSARKSPKTPRCVFATCSFCCLESSVTKKRTFRLDETHGFKNAGVWPRRNAYFLRPRGKTVGPHSAPLPIKNVFQNKIVAKGSQKMTQFF